MKKLKHYKYNYNKLRLLPNFKSIVYLPHKISKKPDKYPFLVANEAYDCVHLFRNNFVSVYRVYLNQLKK